MTKIRFFIFDFKDCKVTQNLVYNMWVVKIKYKSTVSHLFDGFMHADNDR